MYLSCRQICVYILSLVIPTFPQVSLDFCLYSVLCYTAFPQVSLNFCLYSVLCYTAFPEVLLDFCLYSVPCYISVSSCVVRFLFIFCPLINQRFLRCRQISIYILSFVIPASPQVSLDLCLYSVPCYISVS